MVPIQNPMTIIYLAEQRVKVCLVVQGDGQSLHRVGHGLGVLHHTLFSL